jgi:hypothetical protein
MSATRLAITVLIAMPIGACGLDVPEMQEIYQNQSQEKELENTLVANIKCELTLGVHDTIAYFDGGGLHNNIEWLTGWGATVNLKISVDEKSALTPGVTLMDPLQNVITKFPTGNVTSPQSISVGLGVSGSADATRAETIAFTYAFSDLLAEYKRHPIASCSENERGVMIMSDLKIGQFIFNKAFIASIPGSVEPNAPIGAAPSPSPTPGGGQKPSILPASNPPGGKPTKVFPYSTFSDQITFIAAYGGNATPTWKFAKVTADPTSPLFMSSRQKTNDLTITLGKATPATDKAPAALVSQDAQEAHLAALIGQAVATAIQSQQR